MSDDLVLKQRMNGLKARLAADAKVRAGQKRRALNQHAALRGLRKLFPGGTSDSAG